MIRATGTAAARLTDGIFMGMARNDFVVSFDEHHQGDPRSPSIFESYIGADKYKNRLWKRARGAQYDLWYF